MKAKITLYLNDGKGNDGYPIKLIFSHKGKTSRRTIGHSSLDTWDQNKDLPLPSHPDYEHLIGFIFEARKKAARGILKKYDTIEGAYQYLLGSGEKGVSVEDYFNSEITKLRKTGRDGTADAYLYSRNQFVNYAPGLQFDDITPEFLEGFKRFTLQRVSGKTVKNYLSDLRAVYNKAVRDPGMVISDGRPFDGVMAGIKTKRRRKYQRYLNKKNLRKMIAPKRDLLLTPAQTRAVDLSLLQFYLGGANLKDVYYLKWEQFYSNRVLITRSKLGDMAEEIDLRVFDCAREVIDRYQGDDLLWVFPWRKSHTSYKTFRRNHNDDLAAAQKKLKLKLKPVDMRLNSNAMRHSFATIGKFKDIHPDIIRELMGHERNDIDTVYKEMYPKKVRDKAHRKIIKL